VDTNAELDDSPARVQDPLRRPTTRLNRLHRKSDTLAGDENSLQEQTRVALSNETATAFGLMVRWATSRIVRNVPSVPLTRRCVVVVVVKLRSVLLSLRANVSWPGSVA
jgi:hypothetical protein